MNNDQNLSFENLKFNPFQCNSILSDNISDPDFNLFTENNLQNLDTKYYTVEETSTYFQQLKTQTFSILNLNIRSLNKNFEKFKLFLKTINFNFKVICLTETWCLTKDVEKNSLFQLPNYKAIHQVRNKNCKGGGVCIFIHKTLNFKLRNDLSVPTIIANHFL